MRLTKTLPLALMMFSASCASGSETDVPFCDWAFPIYVSKDDKFTGNTAREILEYNDHGAALCGWKRAR